MKILVTGSAGFIGSALTMKLLERGDIVVGIDNHNSYYDPILKQARFRIYNIGNNKPVNLITYIEELESLLGKVAKKDLLPLQPGDVVNTHADIYDFVKDLNYKPKTDIKTGVAKFTTWFKEFYNV